MVSAPRAIVELCGGESSIEIVGQNQAEVVDGFFARKDREHELLATHPASTCRPSR